MTKDAFELCSLNIFSSYYDWLMFTAKDYKSSYVQPTSAGSRSSANMKSSKSFTSGRSKRGRSATLIHILTGGQLIP